jgi:serine/threonine-protein kinase
VSVLSADRNLLFGILALQANLISRDALISAMNTWAVQKATPLGQILIEQGALTTEGHAAVETLVRLSLDRHAGDARKSLAEFRFLLPTRHSLPEVADADIQAGLAELSTGLPPTANTANPDVGPARALGRPTSAGGRFRVLRPHAKGGLGRVSLAVDEELHREVALKEIQEPYADHPDSRSRFVLEAEVTGGLEHPGIVPVYGLGTAADGRPYYAMRFVKGDSLKDAIQRFHQADTSGRDPGERALALRELLGRFVAVCNAVAYAHSRGVLHRDLKPSNVMLGPYGETLVVDWGLAKVVGRHDGAAENGEATLQPTAASGAAPTQAGAVLGTPGYMSPEQAGKGAVGPASDVFSLGATLYHLLTGRVPFADADLLKLLERLWRGEFPAPRQVNRKVPPALEAICLKAMALRPEERYGSAKALADDLEHWLADEPVVAYREPLAVRLGRWRRRHKALVASVTAALVAVLLLGGAAGAWLLQQATKLREGVEAALDRAAELRQQARWAEAEAVLEQAQERLGEGGPDDLQQRVGQARADLGLVRQLDAARLKAATWIEGQFDNAGAERDYAAAFRQAQLGQPGDEVAERLRASAVKAQLVAALDDWAWMTAERRRAWLLAVARRADPDRWRDRFRDPKVWQDRHALERLARQAPVRQWSPQLVTALGRVLAKRGGAAVPLLTAAQARHPQDFWLNFELGNALYERKQAGEAVGYYRAALALRPTASAVHNNLGAALKDKGDWDGAIACFQKAMALHPKHDYAHNNLGLALFDKGQLDGAIACYHKALALDPKYAKAHNNLGNALKAKGQLDGAIACYQKALALDPRYAQAHYNLGLALQDKGDLDGAIACYRKALALDPKLALAHYNLGNALYDKGQLDQAIAWYQKALALAPKHAQAHTNLGLALFDKGELDGAIACYEKALALAPKLVQAHANLGDALLSKGRLDEAIACFQKALALDPKLALAHGALGQALLLQGRFREARDSMRCCLQLLPQGHRLRSSVTQVLRQCERLLVLDARLPSLLQGKVQVASAAERLEYAVLCQLKKLFAAAARCYAEAFAAEPKLADNLLSGDRYQAACAAARAAAGQGRDAGQLTAPERARLRRQALAWLRADLVRWTKILDLGNPQGRSTVQQKLRHWQRDSDLAGIRDAAWLVNLPADELRACRRLWADVAALLKRAGGQK